MSGEKSTEGAVMTLAENNSPYTTGGLLGDIDNPEHSFNFIRVKHGAFALQGFNVKRILQRPYFGMNTNKSDAELLDNFEVPSDLSVDELEERLGKYTTIRAKLFKYGSKISKHTDKLFQMIYGTTKITEILPTPTRKISERENDLLFVYSSVVKHIGELVSKVTDMTEIISTEIQQSYRQTFASRLKQARNERGYTQKQLADELEMAMMTISQYELKKREPSISILARMAKKLKVSADWLIGLN